MYNIFDNDLETITPLSIRITNSVFEMFIIIISTWTVLTQLAIIVGLSFRMLSITFSIIIPLIFLCVVFLKIKSHELEYIIPDYLSTSLILTLGILGASLALFSIRPDADDVDYVSRAVFYLEHPSDSLDLFYRNHALLDFNLYLQLLITEIIELFWAYLSWLFNWKFIDIYHYVVPAIGGMLIPLVWFLVFSKFTGKSIAAVVGAAVVISFLCIDGGTHRSFGNFSFVRIWQGKVFLMAILIPLFITFSMDFFKSVSYHNWIKLLLLGAMSTGFSSSAIFLIPFLAISLGVGYLVSYMRSFLVPKVLAIYLTTVLYPIIIGIGCFSFAQQNIAKSEVLNSDWPVTFSGIYYFIFGGPFTFPSLVFYSSLVLSLVFLKGTLRRFLVGWLAAIFLIFLNPLLNQIIAEHLTSANAYWRLIYILPFPLMIGLPIIHLFQSGSFSRLPTSVFLGGLLILTISINSFPNRLGVFNKIEFGSLRHKIGKQEELDVTNIIAKLPDGAMLAPIRYSSIIPMFTSRLPQIAVRGFELEYFAGINGRSEVAKHRLKAVNYVSGFDNGGFIPFVDLLKTDLRTVVLDSRVADSMNAKKALAENNFILSDKGEFYTLYIRHSSPPLTRRTDI